MAILNKFSFYNILDEDFKKVQIQQQIERERKKDYIIYIFYYYKNKIILTEQDDIWDTAKGNPLNKENDFDTIVRINKEQHYNYIIKKKDLQLIKDSGKEKIYLYNIKLPIYPSKCFLIKKCNFNIRKDKIDYFTSNILEEENIFDHINESLKKLNLKVRKSLIRQGIINHDTLSCYKCREYNCLCNNKPHLVL